jgi:glutathione S-transferase
LHALAQRLADGRRYFAGDAVSIADVAVATALGVLVPLSAADCPMLSAFRRTYETWEPQIIAAVAPTLLAHRDAMYRDHLRLPVAV